MPGRARTRARGRARRRESYQQEAPGGPRAPGSATVSPVTLFPFCKRYVPVLKRT
uniref:Piwi like RNA-mediated gene silencing 3 n=1 Tax=Homo sapiens TaxID=9606 RepID=E9PJG9_HUMAN